MELNDIDIGRWRQIAAELDELCDELASHQLDDDDEGYPDDCLQRRVYERLQVAALDSLFCSHGAARVDPLELRRHVERPRRG